MYKKIVCKNGYISEYYSKTGKKEVLSDFINCLDIRKPDSIEYRKTFFSVFFAGKYSVLYILPASQIDLIKEYTGDYKQWIADVYHCSDIWEQEQTEEEMYIELLESKKQADIDTYVPDPALYKYCAAYWNKLVKWYKKTHPEA